MCKSHISIWSAALLWNKGKARKPLVCKCECLPRVICLPTDTKTRWGEMRCDTRAHTRQVVAVVALMILRAYGSPGETQRRVPDVDCKYPTVVSTTRVGVWLSPSHPFHVIAPCVLFKVFPENFPDLLRYKATAQKIIILLFGCDLDCLRGTMGGDRLWLFGSRWW